jgi:hypothetical protein
MIKVNKIVNPADISLILWASWFGISNLRDLNRDYYIVKKCSGLIPDLYSRDIDNIYFDGPRSYMQSIKSKLSLRDHVREVLDNNINYKIDPSITINIKNAVETGE